MFNKNGTVSFTAHKYCISEDHDYAANAHNDILVLPNIVLMTVMTIAAKYSKLAAYGIKTVAEVLGTEPILKMTVRISTSFKIALRAV